MNIELTWIKNDPEKHNVFSDGSVFLVAIEVNNNKTGKTRWDFDVLRFDCDGESAYLTYRDSHEFYDKWCWSDFDYFILLEGDMPTSEDVE